jgi:hypothetical protein
MDYFNFASRPHLAVPALQGGNEPVNPLS